MALAPAAVKDLVEQHYKKNFNSLVKRIKYRAGTQWNAEDIVQESYLRALKYGTTYTEGLLFDHWFSRILGNTLKDFMRSEREYSGLDTLSEEEETVADHSLPASVKIEVKKAIFDLPVDQREVVELNLLYGYDPRQIVQITNMKYKTIDQILLRFKNTIKEKYKE